MPSSPGSQGLPLQTAQPAHERVSLTGGKRTGWVPQGPSCNDLAAQGQTPLDCQVLDGCSQAWSRESRDHETEGGDGRSHAEAGWGPRGHSGQRRPVCRAPACPSQPPPRPLPSPPHLVARGEGGQLLDLGGLVVAAPPAQQHLAAHPLLGLRWDAGPGHATHHVVQVLQVLGGDRLVVVAVLGEEGDMSQRGSPNPTGDSLPSGSAWLGRKP